MKFFEYTIPTTVGVVNSYIFKYLNETLGCFTDNSESRPSDICITNDEPFRSILYYNDMPYIADIWWPPQVGHHLFYY